MASKTISVEGYLEQRDVDAALYLLSRLLDLAPDKLGEARDELLAMKERLEKSRKITSEDRKVVASTFKKVIG